MLSTLKSQRTVALIYSSLGAHTRFRDVELPATWFIDALAPLGHGTAAVRQALYRMENKGEIEGRRVGRNKLYRLSPYGQAAVDATYRKMTQPRVAVWDGAWSVVALHFSAAERAQRDRVRWLLELEGFASISRGVYVHPQDRIADLCDAVRELGNEGRVVCFRGPRTSDESDGVLVRRLWDLDGMNERYRGFVDAFSPLVRRKSPARTDAQAFALRLALAIRFSEIAWDDPELPDELLPARWAGARARELTNQLYPALLSGALAYGDAILAR